MSGAPIVARRVTLAARPNGPVTDDCFALVEEPLDPAAPVAAGQVSIRVDTLSIDAFIRTTLEERSYHRGARMGGVIPALGVGTVTASAVDGIEPGDQVFGPLGAQTHAVLPGMMVRRLDVSNVPATAYLGALGMTTGLTAYFGMVEVGAVGPADTVVVSGAAGAVGSMAVQIARLSGAARVIGIAGGPAKCAYLVDELGADAAIDHRTGTAAVADRLRELAPEGIDVFFDNVGGEVLDVALDQIAERGRIVLCGAISQYEHMDDVRGPRNYLKLAERHARMEGFAVTHFESAFPQAEAVLGGWLADGRLAMREHVEHGLDAFPATLRMLLDGGHHGKLLLRVHDSGS
jgi:NADPH-dependent curcumin reductase CurA